MTYFLAFLLLLGLSIATRWVGRRLLPLAMPEGFLKTIAFGMVGGLLGSLAGRALFFLAPPIVHVNLPGAVLGTALFMLIRGLLPFLKILVGRVER